VVKRQTVSRRPLPKIFLEEVARLVENTVVVIRTGVKRITLQRTLCSKIVFEEVTLEEIHVLFQNQLWLEQKCLSDERFREKFGKSLEDLSVYLRQANLSRGLTVSAVGTLRSKLKNLEEFLIPKRNLPQMLTLVKKSFYTRPYKESGTPTKLLPPKKVIGRGYRDHGTARNPAEDGSPKWQEVASHVSFLERRIHELRETLKETTEGPLVRLRIARKISQIREELQRVRSS